MERVPMWKNWYFIAEAFVNDDNIAVLMTCKTSLLSNW